jgi:tetratricopeptide (TPR) repeat protein
MKKLIVVFACIICGSAALAQDFLTDAYIESMRLESENKLGESIAVVSRFYDSTDYHLNVRCGHLCEKMGDLYWADIYIQRSLRIQPNSLEARRMLARIHGHKNEESSSGLLDSIPARIRSLKSVSKLEMENDSLDMALVNMNSYLSYFPSDLEGNLIAAHIRFDKGDYSAAKEYLQIAERLRPMFFLKKEFSTF